MNNIAIEIYKTARGIPTDYSLKEALAQREKLEKEINASVNEILKLDLRDMISMMLPLVVAPIKQPEYFGELFGGSAALTHADAFNKMGFPEFSDIQRNMQAIYGTNPKQKYLFSLKEDNNSPAGLSVNKLMLLINSDDMATGVKQELTKVLATMGVPKGYSVSELFKDTLEYTPASETFQQTLTSNLLNTYFITSLAAKNPVIFKGEFNYKLSKHTGRSTYNPDEGEVLFEVSQSSEVPESWFEIFDKSDNEDFDLNAELASHINANLLELAKAV